MSPSSSCLSSPEGAGSSFCLRKDSSPFSQALSSPPSALHPDPACPLLETQPYSVYTPSLCLNAPRDLRILHFLVQMMRWINTLKYSKLPPPNVPLSPGDAMFWNAALWAPYVVSLSVSKVSEKDPPHRIDSCFPFIFAGTVTYTYMCCAVLSHFSRV